MRLLKNLRWALPRSKKNGGFRKTRPLKCLALPWEASRAIAQARFKKTPHTPHHPARQGERKASNASTNTGGHWQSKSRQITHNSASVSSSSSSVRGCVPPLAPPLPAAAVVESLPAAALGEAIPFFGLVDWWSLSVRRAIGAVTTVVVGTSVFLVTSVFLSGNEIGGRPNTRSCAVGRGA